MQYLHRRAGIFAGVYCVDTVVQRDIVTRGEPVPPVLRPARMTLRRKLLYKNLALLGGLLLLGGISLWGLNDMRQHVQQARGEYRELQLIEQIEVTLSGVKAAMIARDPPVVRITAELEKAARKINELAQLQDVDPKEDKASRDHDEHEKKLALSAADRVTTVLAALHSSETKASLKNSPAAASIDTAATEMNQTGKLCIAFINDINDDSERKLHLMIKVIGSVSGALFLVAVLINLSQYRSIVAPLQRLREGVHNLAAGRFPRQPLKVSGDREFVDLANDFNTMASELARFYGQLEEMVAGKSKELVRSERLASVGYLAAGVAHEINNPLNIMSGYAELSIKRLRNGASPEVLAQVTQALSIVREEAFRCKEITEKLLTLSQKGSESREVLSMAQAAEDVALMVRGLKNFRDRSLVLDFAAQEPLRIMGNLTEIKQVLLNLTVNALEAVDAGSGMVRIEGQRNNGFVQLDIIDNGRGMSAQTAERVFEPFFTEKRGVAEPGTGLGLSITHAIIEAHGGQITATSQGPGKGSHFTIRLPAFKENPT